MADSFQDLRAIGDALEGTLKSQFLDMIAAAEIYGERFAAGLALPEIQGLLASGDLAGIQLVAERLVAAGLIPESLPFINTMLGVMLESGQAVTLGGALAMEASEYLLSAVRRFAMDRGEQRVTAISNETVLTMRDTMLDAVKRGVGAEQLGRELRGSIGLLPQHRVALENYRIMLEGTSNISDARRTQLYERYRSRLLAWRAEMIARTETMYAVHAGQMAGWLAQISTGLIQPNRTWIEWTVTEDDRLCPRCAPMDGKRVRFGVPFEATEAGFPEGQPAPHDSPANRKRRRRGPLKPIIKSLKTLEKPIVVYHPPLHPNCRCTIRLRFD